MWSSRPLRRQLFVERLEERDLLAFDTFLQIDSIKGSATTPGHEGEIEILSWFWGVSQGSSHGSGGGGGAGKVSVHDISITKLVDSASPKLALAAVKGVPIGSVEITLVDTDRSTPLTYYSFELKNVLISGYQLNGGGGSGGSIPTETLSLNFDKITWEYQLQGEKKVKGHSASPDTRGADLNGDGTADPVFFNFALLADVNHDGILDIIVARNPNNPDTVVADLNGDGRPDQVRSPAGSSLQVSNLTPGADPLPQPVWGDYDGDGQVDAVFALDVDGDGFADLLTSLKTNPMMP